eukprot:5281192-Prymnesium_polylepis.1
MLALLYPASARAARAAARAPPPCAPGRRAPATGGAAARTSSPGSSVPFPLSFSLSHTLASALGRASRAADERLGRATVKVGAHRWRLAAHARRAAGRTVAARVERHHGAAHQREPRRLPLDRRRHAATGTRARRRLSLIHISEPTRRS